MPLSAHPAQQPAAQPTSTKNDQVNLSGKWIDSEGREYDITQKGDQITLRTQRREEFKSANGVRKDRTFELHHEVNQRTINRKMPEELQKKVLFKQRVLIRGTLSEDGGTIRADFINYDIEDDPSSLEVKNRTEVKTPLSLTLRRAEIYDVEVMDDFPFGDQSKMPYPFKKDSLPNEKDMRRLRRLLVIGKNLPKSTSEPINIVSHDKTVSYQAISTAKEDKHTFERAWEKTFGETQRFADLDSMFVDATLQKGVLPGRQEFTLSGGTGNWVLKFADTKARIQFVRKTSKDQFEDIDNVYLPEKVMLEVHTDLDLPLNQVPLIVESHGKTVDVVAESVPGRSKLYRTPATRQIAVVPKDEPLPRLMETTTRLEGRDNDQIVARMGKEDLLQAPPAMVRVADDPGHLWLTAMRKAAKCTRRSDEDALFAPPDEYETNVNGFDVKIGDHAAMLLLRDEFIRMMEAEDQNLSAVRTNYGLLYGFREMLMSLKWDQSTPWSRIKVTGPSGEETGLGNAVDDQFLTANFKNPNAANQWSLNAVREGVDKFRESIAKAIAEARATDDCDIEKLLELTGVGYGAVIAHVTPRLLKKELDEWVPDTVARAWVNGLQSLAGAVKAQQDLNRLYKSAALGLAAALVPIGTGAFLSSLAMHALNASLAIGGAALEVHEQLEVRQRIEFELGGSAVLGTGRLTEAELEKQPWANVIRSALLQAGLQVGGGVALSKMQKVVSAVEGADLSSFVLQYGTKALKELSKDELTNFLAFAARAKILQAEQGLESLSVAQRRAVLAMDRLVREASQATAGAHAGALAQPVSKIVEPSPARPSEPPSVGNEPVSISNKVHEPARPKAGPPEVRGPPPEPRPSAEPKPSEPQPTGEPRSTTEPRLSEPKPTAEPRPTAEPTPSEAKPSAEPRPTAEPKPSEPKPAGPVEKPQGHPQRERHLEPGHQSGPEPSRPAGPIEKPHAPEAPPPQPHPAAQPMPGAEPPVDVNAPTVKEPPKLAAPEAKPAPVNAEPPRPKVPEPEDMAPTVKVQPEELAPTQKMPPPQAPRPPPPIPAPAAGARPLRPKPGSVVTQLPPNEGDLAKAAGFKYRHPDGTVFDLEKGYGQGTFSRTYAVKEDPTEAVKFRMNGEPEGMSAAEMVRDAKRASEDLAAAGIEQMRVRRIQADVDPPYLIADRLPGESAGYQTFKREELKTFEARDKTIADGRWTMEHERAVVDLYDKLAEHGLVAEDLHIENLYFVRKDGKIVAGILDHDRIVRWDDPVVQKWKDVFVLTPKENFIGSLSTYGLGEHNIGSAREFMAKMFEHKGWIKFTREGGFQTRNLDPEVVRQKFPIDDWVKQAPKPQSRLLPFLAPQPHRDARLVFVWARQWPWHSLACAA